jgi:hypothetical protein
MYSVYICNPSVDDEIIYDDFFASTEFTILEPELHLKDNEPGSFTFIMPASHPSCDHINLLTSVIMVKKNGSVLWRGRPIECEKDFWNNRKYTCEGELAYLTDTILPPGRYDQVTLSALFRWFLNSGGPNIAHNDKVGLEKRIFLVSDSIKMRDDETEPEDLLYRYSNYDTTLSFFKEKLVNRLGGHLFVKYEYVNSSYRNNLYYWRDEDLPLIEQKIEFGKNLLDFIHSWDISDLITVLVPLGKNLGPYTDEDAPALKVLDKYVNLFGSIYDEVTHPDYHPTGDIHVRTYYMINEAAVNTYGRIERVVHWDNVEYQPNLWVKAKRYLKSQQFINSYIEISAIDLNLINRDIEEINFLDRVRIVSDIHGLDSIFIVTELKIPLDDPKNTIYTLGKKNTVAISSMTKSERKAY